MIWKICISLILIIGLTSCNDVDSLAESIGYHNKIECQATGFVGTPSKAYNLFIKLRKKASKEELFQLTEHDSLAVIGYSAHALIDRNLVDPSELSERFIEEKEEVLTFCGCLMGSETLSSSIYHRYWRTRTQFDGEYKVNDSRELLKMDSLILFSNNPDPILLMRGFGNRIYSDKYRARIEEWAFVKKDFYAMKYVYSNLLNSNEEKLKIALKNLLKREEIHISQIEEINIMLSEIG